jgi:hypothetical protein
METQHRRLHPVQRTAEISPHPALTGRAPSVAAKRAVRRALRWYLWPFTAQATAHNRAVADVVEEHRRTLTWMRMETERIGCDAALLGGPE